MNEWMGYECSDEDTYILRTCITNPLDLEAENRTTKRRKNCKEAYYVSIYTV
jgi:hypothetical protein